MVNREQANKVSEDITRLLNEKVDRANQDSILWYGREEGNWYSPITRTHLGREYSWHVTQCSFHCQSPCWGDSNKHDYSWTAGFEWGIGKTSTGFTVQYYPAPLEYYKRYSESYQNEKLEAWRKMNSKIDFSKELFVGSGELEVVSNNFEDVLTALDELIEKITQSRHEQHKHLQ